MTQRKATSTAFKEQIALLSSLSLFSIIGEALRIILEQLFGQACHYENVAWNASNWAPCTTDPGTTDSTGGALFIDLPANMLGCFIMGLFVSGDEYLGIPVDLPVAMLKRTSKWQRWSLIHLGIRTGFCGALTTFASWNTQAVVILCNGKGTVLDSQWVSALFSYAIGLGMALSSFVTGQHAAICIHRFNNRDLAAEADTILDRKGLGMPIHRDLPDFERRFLHDISVEDRALQKEREQKDEDNAPDNSKDDDEWKDNDANDDLAHLRTWKETTDKHRNGQASGGQWQSELREIERAILIKDEEPRQELLDLARDAGWDIDALRNWKDVGLGDIEKERTLDADYSLWLAPLHIIVVALLIWGVIVLNGQDEYMQTYRISALSSLLAPTGTLCRYYLSALNGRIKNPRWEWLPLGTLVANMAASVISVLTVALNVAEDRSRMAHLWLSAIKGGYAGCLSTVSTFSAEAIGLMRALPRHAWAYYYCSGSLVFACLLGVGTYVWAVV